MALSTSAEKSLKRLLTEIPKGACVGCVALCGLDPATRGIEGVRKTSNRISEPDVVTVKVTDGYENRAVVAPRSLDEDAVFPSMCDVARDPQRDVAVRTYPKVCPVLARIGIDPPVA